MKLPACSIDSRVPRRLAIWLALLLSTVVVSASAEPVFLKAFYPLDEPRFHCVDIPGHKERVNVERALSVHTCKEGIWHHDELFDVPAADEVVLRMPHYDQCVTVDSAESGASVRLGDCAAADMNRWRYDNFRLSLVKHPELCLTIGPEPSALTGGGRRLPSRHTARSLAVSLCKEEDFARQMWRFERPQRRTGPVMPFKPEDDA